MAGMKRKRMTRWVRVGSLALLAAIFGLGAAIMYDDDDVAVAEPVHTPVAPADGR